MKALKCELCDSNDIVKEDGYFVCKSCGTKYTTEEAKKLLIEGSVDVSGSSVKIDSSDELKNLYELARRANNEGNHFKAKEYYESILVKSPHDWEATFYAGLMNAMTGAVKNISYSTELFKSSAKTSIELVKENLSDKNEYEKAIYEISTKTADYADNAFLASKSFFERDSLQSFEDFNVYIEAWLNACDLLYETGDQICELFGNLDSDLFVNLWQSAVAHHTDILKSLKDIPGNQSKIDTYVNKLTKYDNSYVAPTPQSTGGCYVATAIYGSYDCPEVWTLRRYRDNKLSKSLYGRIFIKIYYALSPTVVKLMGNKKWFNSYFRKRLDIKVEKLQSEGYKSTKYDDIN